MGSDHPRNTGPMHSAQRCCARTRNGAPCQAPAVTGKKRCRMHGGAAGSGAPKGNTNALKHGYYSRAAREMRREINAIVRKGRATLKQLT